MHIEARVWNARSALVCLLLMTGCSAPAELPSASVTQQSAGSVSRPVAGVEATPGGRFAAGKNCRHIGLLLPDSSTQSRWERRDRPMLEEALRARMPGVTLSYFNAGGDAEIQQQQAGSALAAGACILIVAAEDSARGSTLVQLALQRNVPVIAYDRPIEDPDLAGFVGFDPTVIGQLQGDWISAHAPAGATVALIYGSPNDAGAQLQKHAALSRIQSRLDTGSLKLVYELDTPRGNLDLAASSVAQLLDTRQNDVKVIFAANDDMANAIAGVLQQRGLADQILLTGQDATIEGVRNLIAGRQGMTVLKDAREQASTTADVVAALSQGREPGAVFAGSIQLQSSATVPATLLTPRAVTSSVLTETVFAGGLVSRADACSGLPSGAGGVCP
jgi:D-xylose transport system substrate-binding protein